MSATRPRLAMGQRRFGRVNALGLATLCKRETLRFLNVWTQTLLAPAVTATLFMAVFTVALAGRRAAPASGVPVAAFLAPGIVMMTVLQNAFVNTSSSLLVSKIQGNIVDTLMPPLSPGELLTGLAFGGVARGMAVAAAAGIAAFSLGGVWPVAPLWLLWFAFAGALIMALTGVVAGIFAEKFDQMSAITNFVITPLSFLSGAFYSISILPDPLRQISRANPIFYLIDGFRHGALGVSDAAPWTSFAVSLGLIALLWTLCWRLLASGGRLKP